MEATKDLTRLMTAAMKPLATRGGWTRKTLNWSRRRGGTIQLVNFQLSQGNSWAEARAYVNVGVGFDTLYALDGRPVPDALRPWGSHFETRAESVVPGAPPHWLLDEKTDVDALSAALDGALSALCAWLDGVDGPAGLLARHPLDRGTENYLRARLRYVQGDLDGALAAVRAGVAFFADRGATFEKEIATLHLPLLLGRGP